MTSRKTTTVKGADIEPGQVVKIGGRWMRICRDMDMDFPTKFRYVVAIQHNFDPRMADLAGAFRKPRASAKVRLIHTEQDYLTRDEPAPVWDWVTRQIEREAAER